MNIYHRELIILLIVFIAALFFILNFIVADLPHDFFKIIDNHFKKLQEQRRGRIRDNG